MGGATTGASQVADANLNVVPFIDLLVCLICFLVVSAVWTSLSRIDVDQALPAASPDKNKTPPKPPPTIQVAVTRAGFAVNVHGGPEALLVSQKVPALGELTLCRGQRGARAAGGATACAGETERYRRHDHEGLRSALSGLMAKEGVGSDARVMVAAGDDVPYLHVIATLDDVLHACVDDGSGGKRCLKNPSIGDIGLVKRRGLTP